MALNLRYIKSRRKELGISLLTMAKVLGFKEASSYYRYEEGKYIFKADMLPKIAETLKCKLENLYT